MLCLLRAGGGVGGGVGRGEGAENPQAPLHTPTLRYNNDEKSGGFVHSGMHGLME